MNTWNALLTRIGDLLLAPFAAAPPLAGLVFWSAVFGVVAAVAFRFTSNQAALRRVADGLRANLLAMRLFKDDLGVTLECQLGLLKGAGLRLVHSLVPLAVMIVPFVLLLTQFALRYEWRPLHRGESAVVAVRLAPRFWSEYKDLQLEAPDGVVVQTRPVRDSAEHTVYWRIRAEAPTSQALRVRLGNEAVQKRLAVADNENRLVTVCPVRPGAAFWQRLLYPGEPAFAADAPVQAISVDYPRRSTPVLGLNLPWWLTFLLVSILVAVLVKPLVKVQF